MKSIIFCLTIAFPSIFSLWENCDYYQALKLGETYTISSPEYPNYYSRNPFSCRWTAKAPLGYIAAFNCYMDIPNYPNCSRDRILLSRTGDRNLQESEVLCGEKWFEADSFDQDAVLALYVPYTTNGGRFQCNLSAVKKDCLCGTRNNGRKKTPYIVGGEPVQVNEFPSFAALVELDASAVYCGGTIITPDYVVTACHCLLNKVPSKIGILVGDHNYTSGSDTQYSALYNSAVFIRHEKYSTTTKENDIALIKPTKSIQFNLGVSPACLPFRYQWKDLTSKLVWFVGYGTTDFGGPSSKVPMKTAVRVISNPNCSQKYQNSEKIVNEHICALTQNKDACQGDSGGPMYFEDTNGNLYNVGVISYGKDCGKSMPNVNTRITSYLNWIKEKTGDNYCYM